MIKILDSCLMLKINSQINILLKLIKKIKFQLLIHHNFKMSKLKKIKTRI